jgi:hypothetical protein
MNRGISAAGAIKSLGLDPKELSKMPEEQAFLKIGSAINKLGSISERTAASMAIFRGHGAELLALFSNAGAMDLVTQKLSGTNQILADRALIFRAAAERLEKVRPPTFKEGMAQIGTGIADKTVGEFMTITAKLGRIDFSSVGQDLGEQIALAMEAARTGNLTQFLKDSIITFADFAKTKLDELFTTGSSFSETLIKAAQDLGAELLAQLDGVFASITGGSFLPMFDTLLSGLSTVASILIQIGGVIANITVTLVSWAENLLNKLQAPMSGLGMAAGGAVGGLGAGIAAGSAGALTGAAIGTTIIPGLGTGAGALIGGLVTGIPALLAGGAAGAAVGGVLGADGGPQTLDDKTTSALKAQLSGLTEGLGKGNKALADNIRAILEEAKARETASKFEKEQKVEAAKKRTDELAVSKAQVDYDEAKRIEDDYNKNNAGRNNKLKRDAVSSAAVGSTMREIGGGGTAYVAADAGEPMEEVKTEEQQIAQNTKDALEKLEAIKAAFEAKYDPPILKEPLGPDIGQNLPMFDPSSSYPTEPQDFVGDLVEKTNYPQDPINPMGKEDRTAQVEGILKFLTAEEPPSPEPPYSAPDIGQNLPMFDATGAYDTQGQVDNNTTVQDAVASVYSNSGKEPSAMDAVSSWFESLVATVKDKVSGMGDGPKVTTQRESSSEPTITEPKKTPTELETEPLFETPAIVPESNKAPASAWGVIGDVMGGDLETAKKRIQFGSEGGNSMEAVKEQQAKDRFDENGKKRVGNFGMLGDLFNLDFGGVKAGFEQMKSGTKDAFGTSQTPDIGPSIPDKAGTVTPVIGGGDQDSGGEDSSEKIDALIQVSKDGDAKQVAALTQLLSAVNSMSAKIGSSGSSNSKMSVSLTS